MHVAAHRTRFHGLGALDLGDQLQFGGNYVFSFTQTGNFPLDPDSARKAIATDSNFKNPVVTIQPSPWLLHANKVVVTFTYAGRGSLVLPAAQEMQQVVNTHVWAGSIAFESAQSLDAGGATAPSSADNWQDVVQCPSWLPGCGSSSPGLPHPPLGLSWGTVLGIGAALAVGGIVLVKVL